ncbi:MAG: hypothetical protein E6R09_12820 [Rhodocyclaceae bacterium]|nr:MAG: hypothetical protein E6R09_12820 [Rhodocyclaceae bacterium]
MPINRRVNYANFRLSLKVAQTMIECIEPRNANYLRCASLAINLSNVWPKSSARTMPAVTNRRAARASRPAVRQTFAQKKAAKSGGGSDSDGPCRTQCTDRNSNTLNTAISTIRNGGAK